jgi:hypothetical protein
LDLEVKGQGFCFCFCHVIASFIMLKIMQWIFWTAHFS